MADPLSITISGLALAVSSVTAWLTLFRRGTVKMTQPTVIFFGPDTPRHHSENPLPKIYLRTLLFATSKRGRIIESMHVAVFRNETHQISISGFTATTNWCAAAACSWAKQALR